MKTTYIILAIVWAIGLAVMAYAVFTAPLVDENERPISKPPKP